VLRAILVRGILLVNQRNSTASESFFRNAYGLFKQTFQEWLQDKAPQLGAALAYYTVFSLAPLILVLLAIIGVFFRNDPADAWEKVTQQMSYFLDQSAVQVVQNIAQKASHPGKGVLATVIGVALALFGASGGFRPASRRTQHDLGCQTQTWERHLGLFEVALSLFRDGRRNLFSIACLADPRKRAQSFQPLRPIGFARWHYPRRDCLPDIRPSGYYPAFAIMFKYLPNAKIHWRDVWIGAVMTTFLFVGGKWALGLYLGSGTAGSAYGAASSLITLLLWIYYSSHILLFGAEFTQVYATHAGRGVKPDQYAIRVETKEVETPGGG
jgi:membrane protein